MRHAWRRGGIVAVASGALLAPAPARAAEVALRYSRFLYPSEGGQGAFHLSLAQPLGSNMALAVNGARYAGADGGAYMLTGGVRTYERGWTRSTLYAQVLAGVIWEPGSGSLGVLQPGVGLDLGSGGRAAFRLQLDWPLITLSGPIYLTPQLSVGVVFRPDEP